MEKPFIFDENTRLVFTHRPKSATKIYYPLPFSDEDIKSLTLNPLLKEGTAYWHKIQNNTYIAFAPEIHTMYISVEA